MYFTLKARSAAYIEITNLISKGQIEYNKMKLLEAEALAKMKAG